MQNDEIKYAFGLGISIVLGVTIIAITSITAQCTVYTDDVDKELLDREKYHNDSLLRLTRDAVD